MDKLKETSKVMTVEILFIVIVLLTGLGFGMSSVAREAEPVVCADDLAGGAIGGIKGRMPESSAKIFCESMLGRKTSSYTAYDSVEGVRSALLSGKINSACVTDVTADYMISVDPDLKKLDRSELAAIENTAEPRFEFGMAVRNDKDGEKLCGNLDYAIDTMKKTGFLDDLIYKCITSVVYNDSTSPYVYDTYRNEALETRAQYAFSGMSEKKLYIGITGAVQPVEMLDEKLEPSGFCKEFCDTLGEILGCEIELVVLDNETIFTSLMSGRIDAVFCYGAGRVTTEGSKKWLMTLGYYPMYAYDFVIRADDASQK